MKGWPEKKATQQQTDALLMGHPKDLYEILLKYPQYIASLTLSPSEQARLVNIMLLNTDTGSVASSERECMTSFREANSAMGDNDDNIAARVKRKALAIKLFLNVSDDCPIITDIGFHRKYLDQSSSNSQARGKGILERLPQSCLDRQDYVLQYLPIAPHLLKKLKPEMTNDIDFILKAVTASPICIRYLPEVHRDNLALWKLFLSQHTKKHIEGALDKPLSVNFHENFYNAFLSLAGESVKADNDIFHFMCKSKMTVAMQTRTYLEDSTKLQYLVNQLMKQNPDGSYRFENYVCDQVSEYLANIPPEMFSSVPDAIDLVIRANPSRIGGGLRVYLEGRDINELKPLYLRIEHCLLFSNKLRFIDFLLTIRPDILQDRFFVYQLIRQLSAENENGLNNYIANQVQSARNSLMDHLVLNGYNYDYLWTIVLGVHSYFPVMSTTVIPHLLHMWSEDPLGASCKGTLLGRPTPSSPMKCQTTEDEGEITLPEIDKVLKDFFDQLANLFPKFNTSLCAFDLKTKTHTGKPQPLSEIFFRLNMILARPDLDVLLDICAPCDHAFFVFAMAHQQPIDFILMELYKKLLTIFCVSHRVSEMLTIIHYVFHHSGSNDHLHLTKGDLSLIDHCIDGLSYHEFVMTRLDGLKDVSALKDKYESVINAIKNALGGTDSLFLYDSLGGLLKPFEILNLRFALAKKTIFELAGLEIQSSMQPNTVTSVHGIFRSGNAAEHEEGAQLEVVKRRRVTSPSAMFSG